MRTVRVCDDVEECRHIWDCTWPVKSLFDMWPVRACFQDHFNRRPCFLVAEDNEKIKGLLALSWLEEKQYYAHFPGETWQSKTWLEQNKIPAASPKVFRELLASTPAQTHLRYLTPESLPATELADTVDETGYLFLPRLFNFSFQHYMQQFSGKSRKKLTRELLPLQSQGVTYRYNHLPDLELLFRMNLEAFGEWSYFYDPRFLRSFESLFSWLHANGILRITTVMIGGKVAAVDAGAVWRSTYTILAGGALADFLGIAKIINFHHLDWACRQRLEVVDFLCGDFGWKKRFHLTPRPLYEIRIPTPYNAARQLSADRSIACAS